MIPTRPTQDDPLFPVFNAADTVEDVEWLNEFDHDESWESLRTARITLGLHQVRKASPRRRRKSQSLSPESRQLLETIAPKSPLVKQMLAASDEHPPSVEPPVKSLSEAQRERKLERLGHASERSKKRRKLEKALRLLAEQRDSGGKTNARKPTSRPSQKIKLTQADAKVVLRAAEKLKELKSLPQQSPLKPESSQEPSIGRFGRVVPRNDLRGEKRRRRLQRLREEVRERLHESRENSSAFGISSPFDLNDAEFADGSESVLGMAASFSLPEPGEDPSNVAGAYSVASLRANDDTEPIEESYREWFQRVIVRNRWMTWFTTFYIHWLLLLFLAGVIVAVPEDTADRILNGAFLSEPAEIEPIDQVPFEIEAPRFEEIQESPLESQVQLSLDVASEVAATTTDTTQVAVAMPESQATQPAASVSPVPPPMTDTAVTAGSFSVWTEPAEPRAGEPYRIIIQVRLPPDITRYPVSDLEGVVIGSDGYRKPIPGSASGELAIEGGYARFIVPIVSADEEVRDTVLIRSKLLKEMQRLVLEF